VLAGATIARFVPRDDPREIVGRGYDAIALRYAQWAGTIDSPAMAWVRELLDLLPTDSDVLELGCGRGVPVTRELAKRHRVVGVDLSSVQVELARHHVPEATFVHADALELELPAASYDAVVSLYMLGHVPRGEQGGLLGRLALWLRPGGLTLLTMGTGDAEDVVEEDWLGAPMFFASFDADTNRELLAGAGFELLRAEVVPQDEPGHGVVNFLWVLARKPA
jgi:cyclopropane fatty-acyl-phospholipid synthase-like methyltransferase